MGGRKAPKLKIANFDPKMAFEGQNWPRCTKWGLTNSFRTVKGIFEPMTYKIVLFTNNYPDGNGGDDGDDGVTFQVQLPLPWTDWDLQMARYTCLIPNSNFNISP